MYFPFNVNEAKIKGNVITRQMKKLLPLKGLRFHEAFWSHNPSQRKRDWNSACGWECVDLQNVPLSSLFKSSLNTSFHPHPFSLFPGALKCFERHGKEENDTCTALLLEEVLPQTHRPWVQLFLALAKLGFKKKKKREYPNPTKKNILKIPQCI